MKVKVLQDALAKIDTGLDVVLYSDDSLLLEIIDVSTATVRRSRDSNGTPRLKFESDSKDRVAVIEVTSDF